MSDHAAPYRGEDGHHYALPWEIMRCESGPRPAVHPVASNGLNFGIYLMTKGSWQAAGGLRFARRPDLATRHQQDVIAHHYVEAEGGFQGWACASGLTRQIQGGPSIPERGTSRGPFQTLQEPSPPPTTADHAVHLATGAVILAVIAVLLSLYAMWSKPTEEDQP